MQAICTMPVELYDEELRGYYQPGQVIEGELAQLALERHPEAFKAGSSPAEKDN